MWGYIHQSGFKMRFLLTVAVLFVASPLFSQERDRPFAPLDSAEQIRLEKLLADWEKQSLATQTFACEIHRWDYDVFSAPAGVHSFKKSGRLLYAAPDKAVYHIEQSHSYRGMSQNKPRYKNDSRYAGEHWIVNGADLVNLDHETKRLRITEFATANAAAKCAKQHLPLVFQVDAKELKQRFWIREVAFIKKKLRLIEAWPKSGKDLRTWELIQVVLDSDTLVPQSLVLYSPNFMNGKTHYEFRNIKRNAPEQKLAEFEKNFAYDAKPAWSVQREKPLEPPVWFFAN